MKTGLDISAVFSRMSFIGACLIVTLHVDSKSVSYTIHENCSR